jgi:type VI secretion system protein ImpJ
LSAGKRWLLGVAALPLLSASGGNLDNGRTVSARALESERVVQELAGHEAGERSA